MKQNLLFILLFMSACNNENKAILQPPSDSLLIQHIKAQYSFENKNDGAEFATVDTLFIIAKEPNEDRRWRITYHIKVHYDAPAMGPGFERSERPGLDTDSVVVVGNDLK